MITKNATVLGELKFLIVDDHDFMRRIIAEALSSSGVAKIDRVSDGEEALSFLTKSNHRIDFIISDFNMPRMNGLELLKELRIGNAGIKRDTPVIMLSGFDDESLLVTAMRLDANGFITKPVSRQELLSRLDRIVMGEFTAKEVEVYEDVVIPKIDNAFETSVELKADNNGESPRGNAAAANSLRPQVKMSLGDISSNSVLSEDLMSVNGILVLEAGTTVSPGLIELLKETKKITGIETLTVFQADS